MYRIRRKPYSNPNRRLYKLKRCFNSGIIKIEKENNTMKRVLDKAMIFIDMDGVLARFDEEPKALERFVNEEGFSQS